MLLGDGESKVIDALIVRGNYLIINGLQKQNVFGVTLITTGKC